MTLIKRIAALTLAFTAAYDLIPTLWQRTTSSGLKKKMPEHPGVLLTFDDGPHPVYTPQLLDLLKEHSIKAIFFVVGELAEQHPDLVRRMAQEGHQIGIHHYRHQSAWLMTPLGLRSHIRKTADVINKLTGTPPAYYRPPWGHLNLFSSWASSGYETLLWSDIFGDWKKVNTEGRLAFKLAASQKDGAVYLLHDNGDTPGAEQEAPLVMLEELQEWLQSSTAEKERRVTGP